MSGMQSLMAALKGVETVTKAAIDPKEAGKSVVETGLVSVMANAAKNLSSTSLNTSVDFRAKFLGKDS